MKQFIEVHYYMESDESLEVGVMMHDGKKFHQFILLYYKPENGPEEWSVITGARYYDMNCVLFEIPEEQYFQLSTIWDCPFNMEFICELQKYVLLDKDNWEEKSQYKGTFDLTLEY